MMIDWHSHILPGMDDGSKNVSESLALLNMLVEQGIDTVIATPHFYANDEAVDSFLVRRKKSYEELQKQYSEEFPKILLGSEVRYYPGISKMSELNRLSIEGSNLFLLEMPMTKWTEYTVRELVELAGSSDMTIILAHIERYLKLQNSSTWDRLYESGILMQVNASFFTNFSTRRKALSLISDDKIHFIGSDCHNMTLRPPKIGNAFKIIQKKFGGNFVSQINKYGYTVLLNNKFFSY